MSKTQAVYFTDAELRALLEFLSSLTPERYSGAGFRRLESVCRKLEQAR